MYRNGSVSPQDFDTGKVFLGGIEHEYDAASPFITMMIENGYIEEVLITTNLVDTPKKRGRKHGKSAAQ